MKPRSNQTKASHWTLLPFILTSQFAVAQGFLGHEISLHGTAIDGSGKRLGAGPVRTAVVGPGLEFGGTSRSLPDGGTAGHPPINFGAFSIELDYGETKAGFTAWSGNFNGQVFEDRNGTLPPFASVTIDESVSKDFTTRVFFSPNSIWLNNEGNVWTENSFVKLLVTFGDSQTPTVPSLTPSVHPGMIFEAPTQIGARYTFEESEDMITFTPIDEIFIADAPFKALFVKSSASHLYYRLRMLDGPSIPLQTDFESGAEGWMSESYSGHTQWELGTPDSEDLATAASGTHAWGTKLGGDFGPDTQATLRSPMIDLGTHDNEAVLSFRYYIDTPNGTEGGQLRFVNEAGVVVYTHEEPITGQTDTWTPFRIAVPQSLQNQKFRIEFRFLSDSDDEVGAGWFIDDVLVL